MYRPTPMFTNTMRIACKLEATTIYFLMGMFSTVKHINRRPRGQMALTGLSASLKGNERPSQRMTLKPMGASHVNG